MNELIQFLKSISPLSIELEEYLINNLKRKSLKKNEFLLNAGQVCKNIYFIEEGLFRCFYNTIENKEVDSWFMKEGDVIISVESFFLQRPSNENIISLEESVVYYIDYKTLQFLYETFLEFNIIGRVITEQYYVLAEQRLYAIRMKTAKERYLWLMQNFPQLILRVPSKYLAFYLGISAETFSRMKG